MWLDGFTHHPADRVTGPWLHDGNQPKLVLHTTEGPSVEAALGAYAHNGGWPHFTVDPHRDRWLQHYPLSVWARTLLNRPGGAEMNRGAWTIQAEIVGRAAESHIWPDAVLKRLGEHLVGPVRDALATLGVALPVTHHPTFYGQDAGFVLATESAPQRMTAEGWRAFAGIVGHQHAPENDHWDPGRLAVDRIAYYAGATVGDPTAWLRLVLWLRLLFNKREDEPVKVHGTDIKGAGWVFLADGAGLTAIGAKSRDDMDTLAKGSDGKVSATQVEALKADATHRVGG